MLKALFPYANPNGKQVLSGLCADDLRCYAATNLLFLLAMRITMDIIDRLGMCMPVKGWSVQYVCFFLSGVATPDIVSVRSLFGQSRARWCVNSVCNDCLINLVVALRCE